MLTVCPLTNTHSIPASPLKGLMLLGGAFACVLFIAGCGSDDARPTAINDDSDSALLVQPADSSASDTQPKLTEAVKLRQLGDIDGALRMSSKLLIEQPDDLDVLTLTAELLAEKQEFAEAARIGEQMAGLSESGRPAILTRVHYWYMSARMFNDAERCLGEAIASDPNNAAARKLLGQLLTAQGRRQESATQIRELIRMQKADPNELLSLVDLGSPFSACFIRPLDRRKQDQPVSTGTSSLPVYGPFGV